MPLTQWQPFVRQKSDNCVKSATFDILDDSVFRIFDIVENLVFTGGRVFCAGARAYSISNKWRTFFPSASLQAGTPFPSARKRLCVHAAGNLTHAAMASWEDIVERDAERCVVRACVSTHNMVMFTSFQFVCIRMLG